MNRLKKSALDAETEDDPDEISNPISMKDHSNRSDMISAPNRFLSTKKKHSQGIHKESF